ncbi:MAG: hypothetical protein INH37_16675 [Myxococcaceae bacterium]|nr:hypothetical protein [Myxococcaceae bacterium]
MRSKHVDPADFEDDSQLQQPAEVSGKHRQSFSEPTDGKDATFWHFVTEGKIEDKRTPDRSRIERIAWPRAILVELNAREPRVFTWRDNRPGPQRWLVTLDDFSYLVVVEERSEYALPWTAYPVTHDHQRLKLRREYDAWQRAQKAGAASR